MASSRKGKAPQSAWEVDDWETADYDDGPAGPGQAEEVDEAAQEQANAKTWNDANLDRPQYLISPSSASSAPSSSSSRPPPPAAAFGPSLRILKRPTGGSGSGSRSPTPTAGSEAERKEGLAKREKAYQEARKRIFGGSDGATVGGEDDKERRKEGVETVRSPRGPEDGTAGFRGRGRGRGRGKGTS